MNQATTSAATTGVPASGPTSGDNKHLYGRGRERNGEATVVGKNGEPVRGDDGRRNNAFRGDSERIDFGKGGLS